ncbi:3D domain-containing protein [Thermus igniterrae]|jgi:3D (Asp-Asp-Asp) domain-containing protein|uniref:3D domain-containing protein n=1 Tax=Thermus igniterrae TaxID=88189 RepID=UPI000368840E|nr:3D domain-containing protein [Thermus igniterrae]
MRGLLIGLFLALAIAGASAKEASRVMLLQATAYTSSVRETDRTPFVTATGARTRLGVLAVSPDLLRILPYGTQVRLRDLGSVYGRGRGQFDYLFQGRVFVVADVMHPRMREKVDVWLPDRATALRFGRRMVQLEVVAYPRR